MRATLARRASEGKSLSLPRLRVGPVCGREYSGLEAAQAGFNEYSNAGQLARREREGEALTDRLQSLATAEELQRALATPALHQDVQRLFRR